MKHIRICTVVTGRTIDKFLENLEMIQESSDFVELRVDYIKNLSVKDILRIRETIRVQSIFTCRTMSEGGLYKNNESERKTLFEMATKIGFDFIDIELSAAKHFDFSKLGKAKIILSYHNFDKTQSSKKLETIKKEMKQYPIFCMKFATHVVENNDVISLIKLLLDKKTDENMIVIGMGKKGKITRIIGPLLGSYCTFAATASSQSASGQIDIHTLKNVYASMEKEIPYGR